MNDIYNEKYFDWQKTVGEFGGQANMFKFAEHIKTTDTVLDFGCGGGYLLSNIRCARRLGIEINNAAATAARERGIECHQSLDEIPDSIVNVVISNHALEHVQSPFEALMALRTKMVSNGLLVIVVPCERSLAAYSEKDINQHLYTWNPQLLGNLAAQAGFKVVDVFPIYHKWPLAFLTIRRRLGWNVFHGLARLNGLMKRKYCQIKLIAKKV